MVKTIIRIFDLSIIKISHFKIKTITLNNLFIILYNKFMNKIPNIILKSMLIIIV